MSPKENDCLNQREMQLSPRIPLGCEVSELNARGVLFVPTV